MGLTREGRIEIARRVALQLCLTVAAVVGIGHGAWGWAAGLAAAGVAVYAALPRPQPPDGAWIVDRMPSVYMPDVLAALLVTTFLALPFIIAARDSMLDSPWGPMLMTGIPALVSMAIYWIAASYQCRWVRARDDGLSLATIRGRADMRFDEIARVRGEVRRPPRWLAPLLVLFGGLRGAAIAKLHGNTPRFLLFFERRDGAPVRLPVDSFRPLPALLDALAGAGVALDAELAEIAATRRSRHG